MKNGIGVFVISLFISSSVVAGNITDIPNTFSAGDTLTASGLNGNFEALRAQVDDNANDVTSNTTAITGNTTAIGTNASNITTNTSDIATNASGIATNAAAISAMPGLLIDSFVENSDYSIFSAVTGFVNVIGSGILGSTANQAGTSTYYVPPINAKAHVFARCTLDADAGGGFYYFRPAIRSPAGTGTVTVGARSFYIQTNFPAANVSVFQSNNDFFDLTAGESYDFGVNFAGTTPTTGTNTDDCTVTVMVFSR